MSTEHKAWRTRLACTNQQGAKDFLSGRNIKPMIDSAFLDLLRGRCIDIFTALNQAVHISLAQADFEAFSSEAITATYEKLREPSILAKLNNHGRRCERMAFDWLRGYATLMFFMPAIESLFLVSRRDITFAAKDHDLNAVSFKKSPLADITIRPDLRLEVQAGFQGMNDIKRHKIDEAFRQSSECSTRTILLHFDIFNGRAAVCDISRLHDMDPTYVQRPGMEGKTVMEIPDAWFNWSLSNAIPEDVLNLTQNIPRQTPPAGA